MRLSPDTQRILLKEIEQAVENVDATQTPISAQCSIVRSLLSEQAELLEQSVRPAERAVRALVVRLLTVWLNALHPLTRKDIP